MDRYPIRMFAECGCDFVLWGPLDEPPPTRRPGEWDRLEDELPISALLRERLLAWAQDYYRYDGGDKSIPMDDFDERGFFLSRELQWELGELYSVRYSFEFSRDREDLRAAVADEPVPGWSCR